MFVKDKMIEIPAPTEQEPGQRYPYIGMVGSIGVGKSTLADNFVQRFGIETFREEFEEVPSLEPFYMKGQQEKYSFDCQTTFLSYCARDIISQRGELLNGARIHDSSMEQNMIIADVQANKMDWMDSIQFETYQSAYENLQNGGNTPKPDYYIAILSSKEKVREGIIKRGRPMELKMMKDKPKYFDAVTDSVEEWVKGNKVDVPVYVFDTESFDFVDQTSVRDVLTEDIRASMQYHLFNEHQSQGFGSDGTPLIFPDFLRPQHHIVDIPPGADAHSKRFSET